MSTGDSYTLTGQVRVSDAEAREHEAAVLAKRFMEIPSNQQMRADYIARTDGLPTYLGFAAKGLASSSSGWLLQKFTYDGNSQCTLRQISYDSWDNRASASYS